MVSKKSVPCTIMRGGTSKGLFFLEKDLPADHDARDQLLLEVMGSPDRKQIDGLGGSASVTSKVAIIAPSSREDADVDYTFAQVCVDKALVTYRGNCGNISSAVGPFAIERGLVPVQGDMTTVRIFNTNTGKIILSEVCTRGGMVRYDGDYAIPGVPGTASRIQLRFLDPAGAMTNKLLPTGNPVDVLEVPGVGSVPVSIVDVTNPLAFIPAEAVGLTGTELPAQIDADPALLDRLERVRGVAAAAIGLCEDPQKAAVETPSVPKLAIVGKRADYITTDGQAVDAGSIDLLAKMMSMQKAHPSYAMTGAMCTAAAAVVKGTVVNDALRPGADPSDLRIGHPCGIISVGVSARSEGGEVVVEETSGFRTANLLMDGAAYYHAR